MNASQNAEPQESRSEGVCPKKASAIPTEEVLTQLEGALEEAMAMLKPLTTFHQPVEGAADGDVRVYWDVRVLQGKNTPFTHVTGSSTMPVMLAPRMLIHAAAKIQQEVTDKITAPLVAKFQAAAEEPIFRELAKRDNEARPESESESETDGNLAPVVGAEERAETH